jgi:hypothetical protein
MHQGNPSVLTEPIIIIFFTHIHTEAKYFEEDIIRQRANSHLWIEPAWMY